MDVTKYKFASEASKPVKGFFDSFPNLKTIYWGDKMGSVEGIPDREILLVVPKGHKCYVKNVSEKVVVAIHNDDLQPSDFFHRPIYFAWREKEHNGSLKASIHMGQSFQNPRYGDNDSWFAAVCSHETPSLITNIKSFADYWGHEEKPDVSIEESIEMMLSQSEEVRLNKINEKEEERLKKIESDAKELADRIMNDIRKAKDDGAFDRNYAKAYLYDGVIFESLEKNLPGLLLTNCYDIAVIVKIPEANLTLGEI